MEALLALIGILALIPLALFYSSFSWGFVISKFYLWFIVSAFPQIPHFTILQFIGFTFFLIAIMPKRHSIPIKKEFKNENEHWILLIFSPWITLLCGYLIYCFY